MASQPDVTTLSNESGPVQAQERVQTVDILRGFALFGILAVNISFFSGLSDSLLVIRPSDGLLDFGAAWFTHFFATGKFYSLFSLLFGLGLVIQMERAAARGRPFGGFFAKRMLILLGIGLLHGVLLSQGDILMVYALLGLLLLLFRNAQPRTLLRWIAVLLALPILANLLFAAGTVVLLASDTGQNLMQMFSGEAFRGKMASAQEQMVTAFRDGGFVTVLLARLGQLILMFPGQLFLAFPNIFAMFLLGMYFGKRGVLTRISENLPLLRRLAIWGLVIGVPANIFYATVYTTVGTFALEPVWFLASAVHTIGAPALMLGYLGIIALLVESHGAIGRALGLLAPMGRMALSNYIGQSLVMNLVFYSYGLAFMPALYGSTGPAANLLITAIVFVLQLIISIFWMQRFRFGPVEWVWRTLTYGKAQPMRLGAAQGTDSVPSSSVPHRS